MTGYRYDIRSAWLGRPETPAEIGAKFLKTLDALERLDPLFRDWGTNDEEDTGRGRPIAPLRQDFTQFVEANVYVDDWGRPDANQGYDIWAGSGYFPYAPPNDRGVSFRARAGDHWQNAATFQAGADFRAPDPAIVTYPLFKAVLLTMISIWPPVWAEVRCLMPKGVDTGPPTDPGEPPFPNAYRMPWMAYLCEARADSVRPSSDVLTERTPDGGLLMIAAETRFDPTDRLQRNRSRELFDILTPHQAEVRCY